MIDTARSTLVLAVLLALPLALPVSAQSSGAVTRLAAPGLAAVNVTDEEVLFFGDYFASKLSAFPGLEVLPRTEVTAAFPTEARGSLPRCAEDRGCLQRLSRALGASAVVTGSVGRFGTEYALHLSVVDGQTGASLASRSGRVQNEHAVLPFLEDAAMQIARQLRGIAAVEGPGGGDLARSPPVQPRPGDDLESERAAAGALPPHEASPADGDFEAHGAPEELDAFGVNVPEAREGALGEAPLDPITERARRRELRVHARQAKREAARLRREDRANARNLIRIDAPLIAVGYELRVASSLRIGARLRLSGGMFVKDSLGFGGAMDATALIRFEPWMAERFGFAFHAGLSAGNYAWTQIETAWDGPGASRQQVIMGGAPVLGAEAVFNQVWRVGGELTMFPVYAPWQDGAAALFTLHVGRAFLF